MQISKQNNVAKKCKGSPIKGYNNKKGKSAKAHV